MIDIGDGVCLEEAVCPGVLIAATTCRVDVDHRYRPPYNLGRRSCSYCRTCIETRRTTDDSTWASKTTWWTGLHMVI